MASKLELQSDIQLMEREGAYDAACKPSISLLDY